MNKNILIPQNLTLSLFLQGWPCIPNTSSFNFKFNSSKIEATNCINYLGLLIDLNNFLMTT